MSEVSETHSGSSLSAPALETALPRKPVGCQGGNGLERTGPGPGPGR